MKQNLYCAALFVVGELVRSCRLPIYEASARIHMARCPISDPPVAKKPRRASLSRQGLVLAEGYRQELIIAPTTQKVVNLPSDLAVFIDHELEQFHTELDPRGERVVALNQVFGHPIGWHSGNGHRSGIPSQQLHAVLLQGRLPRHHEAPQAGALRPIGEDVGEQLLGVGIVRHKVRVRVLGVGRLGPGKPKGVGVQRLLL